MLCRPLGDTDAGGAGFGGGYGGGRDTGGGNGYGGDRGAKRGSSNGAGEADYAKIASLKSSKLDLNLNKVVDQLAKDIQK